MSVIGAQNNDVFADLGLSSAQETTAAATDPTELGLDTFLKLMITQMNNQDPMKPMENGEFLGQIAQFASVSGLDELNSSFSGLASTITSGQALQAGDLVGRQVLAPVEAAHVNTGQAVRGQLTQEQRSNATTVGVYDSVGQLVREIPLGPQPAGDVQFTWDGTDESGGYVNAGVYNFRSTATLGGKGSELQTQLFAEVESVNLNGAQGLTLNLQGLGPVAFSNVKQIY